MKTKTIYLGLSTTIALCAASWCAFQVGYDRGISRGTKAEFLAWQVDPIILDRNWSGVVTAQRNTAKHPLPYSEGLRVSIRADINERTSPLVLPVKRSFR
jgi:hypothetical protein